MRRALMTPRPLALRSLGAIPVADLGDWPAPSHETVERYREVIRSGATLTPLWCKRRRDSTWKVCDGRHRLAAARLENVEHIICDEVIHPLGAFPGRLK